MNINMDNMDNIKNLIESHEIEYVRLKKILKEIINNCKDIYTIWFQARLKKYESLYDKIYKRQNDINDINDIIGFRLIYPWVDGLFEIAKILERDKDLNIFKKDILERNKVIYLYGKTKIDTIYEIQLWPTIIYTCFEYEHDKIYKPINNKPLELLSNEIIKKSNYIREKEHELQNIIDNYKLVPY